MDNSDTTTAEPRVAHKWENKLIQTAPNQKIYKLLKLKSVWISLFKIA